MEWLAAYLVGGATLALVIGAFLGANNTRCLSPESDREQGRLKLDDCDDLKCQRRGKCRYDMRDL